VTHVPHHADNLGRLWIGSRPGGSDSSQQRIPAATPVRHDLKVLRACVSYRGNLYSVPWQRIGEFLPVRITENELIVYGTDIEEIARHEVFPRSAGGQKRTNTKHVLGPDLRNKCEILRQRFEQLGQEAVAFFDELVRV
jgi:hypothetical protein